MNFKIGYLGYIILAPVLVVFIMWGLWYLDEKSKSPDIQAQYEEEEKEQIRGSNLASDITRSSNKDNIYIVGDYQYGAKVKLSDEKYSGDCGKEGVDVKTITTPGDSTAAVYQKDKPNYIPPNTRYESKDLCYNGEVIGGVYTRIQ